MLVNWIGLGLGISGILLGQWLEGGRLTQLLVPTAALIVFGGTLGATLLSSGLSELRGAALGLRKVFFGSSPDFPAVIREISSLAAMARKDGILALERRMDDLPNAFFSQNLRHLVDGYEAGLLRDLMDDWIAREEAEKTAIARVFETAAGFSPTVGIIGAVLGLIHVMTNLSDSSKLGSGIAVAFVATVYGVGTANLVFLPIANKLKRLAQAEILEYRLIYAGLLGIQSGLNPRVVEDRLNNLVGTKPVVTPRPTPILEKKAA
jgi:chemotaxis protein MotA